MGEQRVSESTRRPNVLKQLAIDLAKSFRGGALAWLTAGILGAMVAAGTYYYNRIRDTAEERRILRTNMTPSEALAEARRQVGSRSLWAVPFRNRNDPTQYIAVWYTAESGERECAQGPCFELLGGTKVDLLVGTQGLYERESTTVRAGPDFGMISQDDPETAATGRTDHFARYAGITDWNDDGIREIFSLAFSTGTAPTQYVTVSLFDTNTRRLHQLRMTLSRATETPRFVGAPDPRLRAWLGHRYQEHAGSHDLEACNRGLDGELRCRRKATGDLASQAATGEASIGQLMDAWIAEHGRDFVSGKLRLQFRPGLIGPTDDICFDDGRFQWINVFKGPLVLNDRGANRSTVVYVQDGDHHREISSIIRGSRYVWLALAADRNLLAIDTQKWAVEQVEVFEWQDGIPDPYEPGRMLEDTGTKDQQIDGLEASKGRLRYSGVPLTISIAGQPIDQAREFGSARGCYD